MKKKVGLMTLSLMLATPALAGGAAKPVAKPAPAACKSIAATLAGDPQFSTLVTALDAADLTSALSGSGSYTVFAPTNAAFAKVPSDQLAALLNDTELLSEVLTYHVVGEKATAADLRGASAGTTEQGQDVQIKVSGNQISINGARVIKADIVACNGVIHAIDTVLMPQLDVASAPAPAPVPTPAPAAPEAPEAPAATPPAAIDITQIPALPLSGAVTVQTPATVETTTTVETAPAETATTETEVTTEETATEETATEETATEETTTEEAAAEGEVTEVAGNTIYDVVVADEQFSTLRDLLSDADLTDLLMSGEYTLFAPTDAAFAALPEGALAAIASNPEVLINLLKYHVVAGKLSTEQVQAGNLTTAAGTSLTIQANLSPVIESSNGLIYPVDAVLLPADFVVPTVEEVPADTSEAPATTETTTTTTETTTTTTTTTAPATPATPGTAAGGAIAGGNVTLPPADLTAVLQEDRFSTARELLTQADLLGTVSGAEYTVLLPTNDAFARMDPARLAALRADATQLRQWLNYWLVQGRLAADALVAAPLTTAEGNTITLVRDANGLSVDGTALGAGQLIEAGNSNVYVIDSVLLPPSLR